MIKTRILDDGRIQTWSSEGYEIKCEQTGFTFESALDLPEFGFTYVEIIPSEEDTKGNVESEVLYE